MWPQQLLLTHAMPGPPLWLHTGLLARQGECLAHGVEACGLQSTSAALQLSISSKHRRLGAYVLTGVLTRCADADSESSVDSQWS